MKTIHLLPETIVKETVEPDSKLTFKYVETQFSMEQLGLTYKCNDLQHALIDKARLDKEGANNALFMHVIYRLDAEESDFGEQVYLHKDDDVLRVVDKNYWYDYKFYDKAGNNTYYFKRTGSVGCCSNPTEGFRALKDFEHFYRLDNDMVKIIVETV